MSDREQDVRDAYHNAIQSAAHESEDANVPEGAALVGWVVIAEWAEPGGDRRLCITDGAPGGDLPQWQVEGYMHYALSDQINESDFPEDEA